MRKLILNFKEYVKLLEDGAAMATASGGVGMGNVTAPQPSTNIGNLNGSGWSDGGGTIGSGDIASTLGGNSEKKYHDPTVSNKKIKKKKIKIRKEIIKRKD
jgi:hypothetical protein